MNSTQPTRALCRRSTMVVFLLSAVSMASGCAGVFSQTPQGRLADPEWRSWRALVEGQVANAEKGFASLLEAQPGNLLALFGQGSIAFDQGQDARAADAHLRLLERIASDKGAAGAWAADLSTAAAARLALLMPTVLNRPLYEDRLVALPPAALPWTTRFALALLVDDIARARGDARLLATTAAARGCVGSVTVLPSVGRLPHLDLEAPAATGAKPLGVVAASGCRLNVPEQEGHPGVRRLQARIAVAAGEYEIVLDFPAMALLRVDGGPWHHHGSAESHGPRWSALRVWLPRGEHAIELRLASFGGAAELALMVSPAAGMAGFTDGADPRSSVPGIVADLSGMLAADLRGDVDRVIRLSQRLANQRNFSSGLAACAHVAAHDVTLPGGQARDQARAFNLRAVALAPGNARAWRELAVGDLANEKPREAAENAQRAWRVAPGWWPAGLCWADALRSQGLERDADLALQQTVSAVAKAGTAPGACALWEAAFRQARQRDRVSDERRFAKIVQACDAQSTVPLDQLRMQGDLAGAESALQRLQAVSRDPLWVRSDLATVRLARGFAAQAVEDLETLVVLAPRDVTFRLRLADALVARGDRNAARAVVTRTLQEFPTRVEVRQAARAFALPMPLDDMRIDGASVIRDFAAAGRSYPAPAVMVLDRTVARVFSDGTQVILTHNIVRVQGKEGIERWGEVAVPAGAEVLSLRTHKPDGRIREPEEISGKETISAADLAVGDFVEWETLEFRDPTSAFAPGFLGERFYFQSTEAPLVRSEYLLVTPADRTLDVDTRAGGPTAVVTPGRDNTKVTRFETRAMPQLFGEAAAVSPVDWIPSVRVSSGVSLRDWSRYLFEQTFTMARISPAVRSQARQIVEALPKSAQPREKAAAITRWVTSHIEAEQDLLEPASTTLSRGRGNRVALILALSRSLDLHPELLAARPLETAAAEAPVAVQELDDFSIILIRFPDTDAGVAQVVDPRWRRAPFGYLPPALDGAAAFAIGTTNLKTVATSTRDSRKISLKIRIAASGLADVAATEQVQGWPAIEWAEILESVGGDKNRLRQDFEQRWLSVHFPGAVLKTLEVTPQILQAEGTEIRYTFSAPQMALRNGSEYKLQPTFFRAQPGRRYATLPTRRTALLVGSDVPVDLDAQIELPPGALVVDPGASAVLTAGPAAALRFVERRSVDAPSGGAPDRPMRVRLRRQTRLSMLRIASADYEAVAAVLRKVDPLEQAEIRFVVGQTPGGDK